MLVVPVVAQKLRTSFAKRTSNEFMSTGPTTKFVGCLSASLRARTLDGDLGRPEASLFAFWRNDRVVR